MDQIEKALFLLRQGDVVGMPTETVYGLAADITLPQAILKIFKTKERPFFDPLIVHVNSIEMAKTITSHWPKSADFLAKSFWPGPLTLILKKESSKVSDIITSGLDKVGIRLPNHPTAINLITRLGNPIAAPSANKFKKTSPTCSQDVKEEFPDLFVLEGGQCDIGIESTIIMAEEKEITILRPGIISKEILKEAIEKSDDPQIKNLIINSRSALNTPGNMKDHYCPKIPFYIVKESSELSQFSNSPQMGGEITLPSCPYEAARLLYKKLREGANNPRNQFLFIIKDSKKIQGVWISIWDRLFKASTNY